VWAERRAAAAAPATVEDGGREGMAAGARNWHIEIVGGGSAGGELVGGGSAAGAGRDGSAVGASGTRG
jgi:hypothetical protein